MRKMTPKQQRFVEEYLVDLNATKAAIRAGYARTTASKKAPLWVGESRDTCPANMLQVWDAVQEGMRARSERLQIKQDCVLLELARIAFSDISKLFDEKGHLKPIMDLDKDISAALKDIYEVEKNNSRYRLKIKMHDKNKALELLGRHLGIFNKEKPQQQNRVIINLMIPPRKDQDFSSDI